MYSINPDNVSLFQSAQILNGQKKQKGKGCLLFFWRDKCPHFLKWVYPTYMHIKRYTVCIIATNSLFLIFIDILPTVRQIACLKLLGDWANSGPNDQWPQTCQTMQWHPSLKLRKGCTSLPSTLTPEPPAYTAGSSSLVEVSSFTISNTNC